MEKKKQKQTEIRCGGSNVYLLNVLCGMSVEFD